ncbi:hypothetical protein HPG69_000584 [Diceros bicornis minor]|uniref:Uncharacterized protein n=1 Tax=Diceros bicornis minor TaxID=77932 RepID=A0A7J7FI13_DICBM|nr:hypothetical protein HPG69_000584 [Diceros bicornis minor]
MCSFFCTPSVLPSQAFLYPELFACSDVRGILSLTRDTELSIHQGYIVQVKDGYLGIFIKKLVGYLIKLYKSDYMGMKCICENFKNGIHKTLLREELTKLHPAVIKNSQRPQAFQGIN